MNLSAWNPRCMTMALSSIRKPVRSMLLKQSVSGLPEIPKNSEFMAVNSNKISDWSQLVGVIVVHQISK
ncbi:hypothetical protein OXB_0409 [Bacillus sp. OxB-1]|nr:hypothetical protein OXB_0409 [Bacillus sp. OxB-1]